MARRSSIHYYTGRKGYRDGYYTCYKGKQHALADGPDDQPNGPTFLRALSTFQGIMELENVGKQGHDLSVATVCDLRMQYLVASGNEKGASLFQKLVTSGVEVFGDVKAMEIRPHHVREWLQQKAEERALSVPGKRGRRRGWGRTSQRMALNQLRAALTWAVTDGLITGHGLQVARAFRDLKSEERGPETYLDRATFEKLYAAATRVVQPILRFLYETGCRPAEACALEARYYQRTARCVLYRGKAIAGEEFVWKNAKRTGKDRRILVSNELVEMVERLCEERPEGPLFLTRYKTPWSSKSLGRAVYHLRTKIGLKQPTTPYSFRHSYATDFLLRGGSIKLLADLLGTSVAMLERHYSHLEVNQDIMRAAMAKVMDGRAPGC